MSSHKWHLVISERTDIGKQWFQGSTHPWRCFECSTPMLKNDLLMNVWKWGLKVLKMTPKLGKNLILQPDTHLEGFQPYIYTLQFKL